jgi:hypothetical protein
MFKRIGLILMSLMLTTSCVEPNVLSEFSQKDSDEALFVEAQKKLDATEWAATLDILENRLSSSYRAQNKVQDMRASAYAGRCGLLFFTFVNNLANSNSTALFNFFMKSVTGRAVNPADCQKSYQITVDTYGPYASRTSKQNFNVAILGMAKAGAFLRKTIDQDYGGAGDGFADAGVDICDDTILSDDDVADAFVGFGIVLENLAAVSTDLAGGTVTQINDFKDQCATVLGSPCSFTDRAFILSHALQFRSILNEPTLGVGNCTTDTPFTACPCGDGF